MERLWYFEVRYWKDGCSSYRTLSAPTLSGATDKAFGLYVETWNKAPDEISVVAKNTYSFKQYN